MHTLNMNIRRLNALYMCFSVDDIRIYAAKKSDIRQYHIAL